jgi:hypothetical protein
MGYVAFHLFYDVDLASVFYNSAKIHRKQSYNSLILLLYGLNGAPGVIGQ